MIYIISLLLLIVFSKTQGQEKLTKEEALEIALEQNFGIKVSRNVTEIIKNNSGVLNSGYLPTVSILPALGTNSSAPLVF